MRRKDDQKQLSIKQAVIKTILAEGFHGASISKIAKAAGVSPATVYVYYDSKDAMLRDIYKEYSEDIYSYVVKRVTREMDGKQLIESLVRSYYNYILEHGEVFYFVEQFSSCPALVNTCRYRHNRSQVGMLLDEMKKRQVIKNVDNTTITALMFNPVKSIALQHEVRPEVELGGLEDLIRMIQDALLKK
ncbi:MAG: TetR/AcrR family transcriptional regulator [Syntrophomonadaceae bacterium]